MTEVHRIRLFDYVPSSIRSISLNPKGDYLLVGRDSGYLEIWNVEKFAFSVASIYVTCENNIRAVSWCKFHDQPSIVVALLSGELSFFDFPSLKSLDASTDSYGSILALAVNKAQDRIAVARGGTRSPCVLIFSTAGELTCITSDQFDSPVLSVCFNDDGDIFAGSSLGQIRRIDPDSGRIVTTYNLSSSDITVFAVCGVAGGCFASGDSKGQVLIWDPMTATVVAKFSSNKSDVRALTANDQYLWASGIDPTVVCFAYNKKQRTWAQKGHLCQHISEVTCLTCSEKSSHAISGSTDSTIFIRKKIYPYQRQPPISSAKREDGSLTVAGGIGHQISVWKLDGKVAKLELTLKTDESRNHVECIAMSPDGKAFAYSAGAVKLLRFNESGQWKFDNEVNLPPATSLAYSANGILYSGFLDGNVISDKDESINVGFPVMKIAVSSNGQHIVAGGINNMVLLDKELTKVEATLPSLGAPFSTFEFQPFKNRLFIATNTDRVYVYNVLKKKLLNKMTTKFGKHGDVAANTICFATDNNDQILISSSQRAIVRKIKKERIIAAASGEGAKAETEGAAAATAPEKEEGENAKKPYNGLTRLPYNDILFITYAGPKQIIVFEKPWMFMINNIPYVFRPKQFLTHNEENMTRY